MEEAWGWFWTVLFGFQVAAIVGLAVVLLQARSRGQLPRQRQLSLGLLCVSAGTPIVGIVVTAIGMWLSFNAVKDVNQTDKATILAAGISEAINCGCLGSILGAPPFLLGVFGLIRPRRVP